MTGGGSPVAAAPNSRVWLAAVALVLFPLLKYGVAFRLPLSVLTFVTIVVTYGLAIYLFRTISTAVYYGELRQILAAGAMALVAGWLVCHPSQRVMMISETTMIAGTGALVGVRLRAGDSGLKAFMLGALVVILGGIVMFAREWGPLMTIFETAGRETIDSFTGNLTAFGYHPEAAQTYANELQSIVKVMARLVPAATVINMVAQFAVGFMWFLTRGLPEERSAVLFAPLTRWKVPFAMIGLVIAAALGRLFGGEIIALIADNLFLALTFCYCIGGVAFMAHLLVRLQLPLGVKILFYIAMILTGLIGYMLVVLLGFIDSFADWRKLSAQSIELDKR